MPAFDLKTIIFMSMLLTFMLSMLLAITRTYHKEISGPGYWAIGNLVLGLGMVILFSKFNANQLEILPGVALVGAGLAIFINGIQAYLGRKIKYIFPVVIILVLLLVNAYFMIFHHNMRVMVIINALIFALIYFAGARATFGREDGLVGNLFWIASSFFLMMAFLLLARIVSAFYLDDIVFKHFSDWPINAFTLMLACITQLLVSMLFVLILSAQVNQNLQSIATVDSLTNALNRRGTEDAALKMQAICLRIKLPMSVLLIDIDHFKKVNDVYGHLAGDKVLMAIAKTIKDTLRGGDVLGRFGGEEFVVLLPNTTEKEAVGLAERIRAAVFQRKLYLSDKKIINCSVSIGVTDSDRSSYEIQRLIASADSAMYLAKNSGRNLVATHAGIAKK